MSDRNDSSRSRRFLCDKCVYSTESENDFDTHYNTNHKNAAVYFCRECGLVFTHVSTLVSHIKTDCSKSEYIIMNCGIKNCEFSNTNPFQFIEHCKIVHRNVSLLPCFRCGKFFTYPAFLIKHIQIECDSMPSQATTANDSKEDRPKITLKLDSMPNQATTVNECKEDRPKITLKLFRDNEKYESSFASASICKSDTSFKTNVKKQKRKRTTTDYNWKTQNPFSSFTDDSDPDDPTWEPEIPLRFKTSQGRQRKCSPHKQQWENWRSDVMSCKTFKAFDILHESDHLLHFFKCMSYECDFTCDDDVSFASHQIREHFDKKLPCLYCLEKIDSGNPLVEHTISKHGSRIYQCSRCLYRAASKSQVKHHFQTMHIGDGAVIFHTCKAIQPIVNQEVVCKQEDVVLPYRCGIQDCTYESDLPTAFVTHNRNFHANLRSYPCAFCKIDQYGIEVLMKHLILHGLCKFQCAYCLFGAEDDMDVTIHQCLKHADFRLQLYKRPKSRDLTMPLTTSSDQSNQSHDSTPQNDFAEASARHSSFKNSDGVPNNETASNFTTDPVDSSSANKNDSNDVSLYVTENVLISNIKIEVEDDVQPQENGIVINDVRTIAPSRNKRENSSFFEGNNVDSTMHVKNEVLTHPSTFVKAEDSRMSKLVWPAASHSHPDITQSKDKKYMCDKCKYSIDDEALFESHQTLLHKKDGWFSCKKCGRVFHAVKELVTHIDTECVQYMYVLLMCAVTDCEYTYTNPVDMVEHLKYYHRGVSLMPCWKCNRFFTIHSYLIEHMQKECPYEILKPPQEQKEVKPKGKEKSSEEKPKPESSSTSKVKSAEEVPSTSQNVGSQKMNYVVSESSVCSKADSTKRPESESSSASIIISSSDESDGGLLIDDGSSLSDTENEQPNNARPFKEKKSDTIVVESTVVSAKEDIRKCTKSHAKTSEKKKGKKRRKGKLGTWKTKKKTKNSQIVEEADDKADKITVVSSSKSDKAEDAVEIRPNEDTVAEVAEVQVTESQIQTTISSDNQDNTGKHEKVKKVSFKKSANATKYVRWRDWFYTILSRKSPKALETLDEEHNLRNFFTCMSYACEFSTNSVSLFCDHQTQEHLHRKLPCLYCFDEFEAGSQLTEHTVTAHSGRIYQCSRCLYRAATSTQVDLHFQTMHHSETTHYFKCEAVGYVNNSPAVEREEVVLPYICQVCLFSTEIPKEFVDHNVQFHRSVSSYPCAYCKTEVDTADALIQHFTLHGLWSFQCAYCVFGADAVLDVLFHQCLNHADYECKTYIRPPNVPDNATSDKPGKTQRGAYYKERCLPKFVNNCTASFPCIFDQCHQTLPSIYSYEKHLEDSHAIKTFQCPHCPEVSLTVPSFKEHLLMHGPNLYMCSFVDCGFVHYHKETVDTHSKEAHKGRVHVLHAATVREEYSSGEPKESSSKETVKHEEFPALQNCTISSTGTFCNDEDVESSYEAPSLQESVYGDGVSWYKKELPELDLSKVTVTTPQSLALGIKISFNDYLKVSSLGHRKLRVELKDLKHVFK